VGDYDEEKEEELKKHILMMEKQMQEAEVKKQQLSADFTGKMQKITQIKSLIDNKGSEHNKTSGDLNKVEEEIRKLEEKIKSFDNEF